jgi:tRNA uridine 5-carboxymethylaminomethyl modification enzyme
LVQKKEELIQTELARLHQTRMGTDTLAQALRRPEVTYATLPGWDDTLPAEVVQQVEISIKYAGYIDRQSVEVEKLKSAESKQIPDTFDYARVPSLRVEARQKLSKIRPATVGQAARISGVSPSDIGILMVWLKRGECSTGNNGGIEELDGAGEGCGGSDCQ